MCISTVVEHLNALVRLERKREKSYRQRQRKWEEENIWKVSGTSLSFS